MKLGLFKFSQDNHQHVSCIQFLNILWKLEKLVS